VRFLLCGKNDAAVAGLEHLVASGDEVWAIGVHGDDGRDGWQRSLRGAAERLDVRFAQPRRINAPEVIEELHDFGARALISIQYDQILKNPLFRTIGCPCLNLHFSLLPRNRGVSPIAWAVAEGDEQTGVTLHHMVEDIDAGDVIAQREVPIGRGDSARDVYDAVTRAAVSLFRESHPFPDSLLKRRLAQDRSRASYHAGGEFDFAARSVVWKRPAIELQPWLRALVFPPHQHPETLLRERVLEVTRVGPEIGDADGEPGTVVSADRTGVEIATGAGSVRLLGLREPTGADVISTLKPGDRFE
jgi:methionyl-tRNA formyltransferase